MSTPEKPRPSLDDTLARIEQALVEPVPNPPCLQCARQALLGEPYCAAHKRIPREMIEELGPVTRDGNTFTINQSGVYQIGNTVPPHGKPRPASAHLLGAPGPTCPGCAADAARPGWLARALHRLFGDGAS